MARRHFASFVVRVSSFAIGLLAAHGAAAQSPQLPPPPPPERGTSTTIVTTAATASTMVLVHLDTPSDVDLEVDLGGGHWQVACSSPCDRPLGTNHLYRINGSGVRASHPFEIEAGQKVTLEVDPASSAGHGLGIAVTIIGVAGLAPGAAVTAGVVVGVIFGAILVCPFAAAFASKANQNSEYSSCIGDAASLFGQAYASPYVWVPAIVGGVAIATGITMLVTSSSTTIRQSTPTSASDRGMPDMWRAPAWHESAGVQYPRAQTADFVNLSF
jgi:hypothetical protein